ncbi:hypothetical protein [Nonomuraea dietziae]|uniref:hypothetical protein n=1 Tax=Nonomuraea dietziae TaxID=65515 RepID=UPI003412A218
MISEYHQRLTAAQPTKLNIRAAQQEPGPAWPRAQPRRSAALNGAREPAVLRVELQQDRESESSGITLSGDQVALFVQDRPVLNQLVDVHRGVS